MAKVADKYQSRLDELKKMVREYHDYFTDNYEMYHRMRRFVYKSNLTVDEISKLNELDKPALEFNVLPSYVSRLIGEWAKQEPSISAHPAPDAQVDPRITDIYTGHFRYIIDEANRQGFETATYTDTLTGGFSAFKVYTEYESERSFNQAIKIRRTYDPTLTGFDPMATLSTKADGKYCFELFPMSEDDFKREYEGVSTNTLSYTSGLAGFSWAYRLTNKKIILVCELFEKKERKKKLYKLADGQQMYADEYEKLISYYEENNIIAQVPIIIDERMTTKTTICRYKFIENQVLEYEETDYDHLPIIFVDGNSMLIRDAGLVDSCKQVVRPYVACAVDAQRLKNLAGQTLANDIELLQQSKMKVAKESIPSQYMDAYTNPQRASTYVYNAFKEDGITPIPPPQEVMRVPLPAEIPNTFIGADNIIQNILGTFNAARGVDSNEMSGRAIIEAASQSNQTAQPYIVNYLLALTQAGQIIADLLPKYCLSERELSIIGNDGQKTFARVNYQHPDSPMMQYSTGDLKILVEAGTNYEIEKRRELETLIMLSQTFPVMNQFINSQGIGVLLDALNFAGSDQLKAQLPQWQQQQMQQQQQQGQQNPEMMKMQMQMQQAQMSNQTKQQEMMLKAQMSQQDMMINKEKLEHEKAKLIFDYVMEQEKAGVQMNKAETERLVHAAELAMNHKDMEHNHARDILEHMKSQNESSQLQ